MQKLLLHRLVCATTLGSLHEGPRPVTQPCHPWFGIRPTHFDSPGVAAAVVPSCWLMGQGTFNSLVDE
ncbi:hypothetical protein OPV22_009001 [Ensete ventricosum]|uniref:Secreted protein n=1 Tax=Ensete ventricosum TaxID=4639 RepID=A0AAV8RFZ2_ENSVE|nr:hypothetical protein OPV22_009001 [Ensete ventricosum]